MIVVASYWCAYFSFHHDHRAADDRDGYRRVYGHRAFHEVMLLDDLSAVVVAAAAVNELAGLSGAIDDEMLEHLVVAVESVLARFWQMLYRADIHDRFDRSLNRAAAVVACPGGVVAIAVRDDFGVLPAGLGDDLRVHRVVTDWLATMANVCLSEHYQFALVVVAAAVNVVAA